MGQRGAVTAETMVVLPVLVSLLLAASYALMLGLHQIRLVDSARDAARELARSHSVASAREAGLRNAPKQTRLSINQRGPQITVVASSSPRLGGLWRFVPRPQLKAQVSMQAEPR